MKPEDLIRTMQDIPKIFYAEWYRRDVSPNLSNEEKMALMHKLSELSLRKPFWLDRVISLDDFPELKPFSHTKDFSGIQLYVVFCELFNEMSKTKISTPYPHFSEKEV